MKSKIVKTTQLTVHGLPMQVQFKRIKSLRMRMIPPHGKIKISAPVGTNLKTIELFVLSRWGWVEQTRHKINALPRKPDYQYIDGEAHWFRGQSYTLVVGKTNDKTQVILKGSEMQLLARPNADAKARQRVLERWYREEMKKQIPPLLDKWQPIIGKEVAEWGIRKMKTRWGSCNITARRIWLNLGLIRKPPECLEYVFVHEMVHLLERYHNRRFYQWMTHFLPGWRARKEALNALPV